MEKSKPEIPLSPELTAKQILWDKTLRELDHIGDALGYRIDPGIKETVTAFIVNKFPTYSSCEGHVEERFDEPVKLRPYIAVGLDEPKQRYVGEQELRSSIAKQFDIPVDKLEDNVPADTEYWQYIYRHDVQETPEFLAIRAKNEELQRLISVILASFYKSRVTSSDSKLVIERIGPAGHFRVTTAKEAPDKIEKTDIDKYQKELLIEQSEMKAFTQFLKDRFFNRE